MPTKTLHLASLLLGFGILLQTPASAQSKRGIAPETGHTVKILSQNWNDAEATWFYSVPQGSWLLRYEWFINLEQAESQVLFRDSAHFQSLGYIARGPDPTSNPHGLAVGFVRDEKKLPRGGVESYVGMTCAACHTGHVNFNKITCIIDGGPTNGNFEKLQRSLAAALAETLADNSKFDRFASRVIGPILDAAKKNQLRTELAAALKSRSDYNERNLPGKNQAPFGHGRVDAFGAIMNEVAVRFAQVPDNAKPADAPVSYPVLWDAPQHDFVQWNGAAENKRSKLTELLVGTEHIGALGRNTGEVLGVFGEIDATTEPSIKELKHYPNSANRGNLIAIEDSLRKLWSPVWPDEFPPIDAQLRTSGEKLFNNYCIKCHEPIDRDDPARTVKAIMSDEKTDIAMVRNFLTRTAKTGILQGRRIEPLLPNPEVFGDEAPVALMLKHLVQRAIIRSTPEILEQSEQDLQRFVREIGSAVEYQISGDPFDTADTSPLGRRFPFDARKGVVTQIGDAKGNILNAAKSKLRKIVSSPAEIRLHYKARPLNGIWASAPYLHNGSIPNLDELLKRPAERSNASFRVGSREFDPVKVGFKTDSGEEFNPTLPGNTNGGHDYHHSDGRSFSETERKQLIEYLKSL